MIKSVALVSAIVLASAAPSSAQPSIVKTAKHSGLCKTTVDQWTPQNTWTSFAGCKPFDLNGSRALFFAQLHLKCSHKPRWVKIRLARLTLNGIDSTGTNSWTLGKNSPRKWQGSLWWESRTKHPIVAQWKYGGGSCTSTQRQFKWWQP